MNSPVRMDFDFSCALLSVTGEHVAEILPQLNATDAELAELQAAFENIDVRGAFRRAVSNWRGAMLSAYSDGNYFRDAAMFGYVRFAAERNRVATINDQLDFFEKVLDAAKDPWPEALARFSTAEEDLAQQFRIDEMAVRRTSTESMRPLFAIRVRKNWGTRADAEFAARADANRVLVVAGIATHRYRQRNQKLPNELADLVPTFLRAVPSDPLAHAPLKYRREVSGLRLWSVNSDFADNEGITSEERENNRGDYDLVFRLDYESRLQPTSGDPNAPASKP